MTTTNDQTATYSIPLGNIDTLTARIDALNKRARRHHLTPISYVVSTTPHRIQHEYVTTDSRGSEYSYVEQTTTATTPPAPLGFRPTGRVTVFHQVTVTGQKPQIDGWEFVAVLEPLELEDGTRENLVRSVPGLTGPLPDNLRHRIGDCDQCCQQRRRNETFVLRSTDTESQTYKVVGRNCLKDFVGGHADPHQLALLAELLFQLNDAATQASEGDGEGGGGGGGRSQRTFDLSQVLTWTAAVIRKNGWVSKTRANDSLGRLVATATHVVYLLSRPPMAGETAQWEQARLDYQPTANDQTNSEAALTWAIDQTNADNDYLRNVNLIARVGYTTHTTFGLAVSIVAAYQREEAKREEVQMNAASRHQGTLKQRSVFTLKVVSVFGAEGQYGTIGIHRMRDVGGNVFTWFASPGPGWLEVGDTYSVKATVKAHDTYNGVQQTILSRVTPQK